MQIPIEAITFNGFTLEQLLEQAAKRGAELALAKPEDPLKMIRIADLAKQFDCSIRTIARRIDLSNIKKYKIGRHISIYKKDVDKILKYQ